MRTILVTGGYGFIGSNFLLRLLREPAVRVINVDSMTYAANPLSLQAVESDPRLNSIRGDIADRPLIGGLLAQFQPDAIVNFAAESHVDRSIVAPDAFLQTNIFGTFNLLEATKEWLNSKARTQRGSFRFLHVSTDEVFGSLGPDDEPFHENTRYSPNSPYAASKAASDHFVRAYHHTYGLPAIITNCSNNYGPRQHPEKLVPLMILNALGGKSLPVYGDGQNVRDWLFVEDHCEALMSVLARGVVGETYAIGGNAERGNLQLLESLCALLDASYPRADGRRYREQIVMVADRPGHDRRYAINSHKLCSTLGWRASETLESALTKTIEWYVANPAWVDYAKAGGYDLWIERNYATR